MTRNDTLEQHSNKNKPNKRREPQRKCRIGTVNSGVGVAGGCRAFCLGQVVHSIVNSKSSLMTSSLTIVAKVFSNTLIFLLYFCCKNMSSFCNTHFFSKKYQSICHISRWNNFFMFLTTGSSFYERPASPLSSEAVTNINTK